MNLRRKLSPVSSACAASARTLVEAWGRQASQSELSLPPPPGLVTTETYSDPGARRSATAMAASSLSDDEASGTSSRKRKLGRNLNPLLWGHSRKPVQGIEPTRNAAGRRIWYCSRVGCEDYSVVSAAGIRWHLERHHGILLGEVEPGAIKKAKQQDLTTMFGEQKLVKDQQAESELRDLLRSIADKDRIQ